MGSLVKKFGAGAISVALVGCGGGSESDSKLPSAVEPTASRTLSGVVMDGYLVNANVCLDKNQNSICDSGDGAVVQTNSQGRYQLPIDGDTSGIRLLVEAIEYQTIDLDNPNQPIESGYTLEQPAAQSAIISPMTSIIASLAEVSGESFEQAAQTLASDLNVSVNVLKSDYVAGSSVESRNVHMLARAVTRVIQSGQKESQVTLSLTRKGSFSRLASLDVAAIKATTDKVSQGTQSAEDTLNQIAIDYRDELKISQQDVKNDAVITVPRAPKHGLVNDAADSFDWKPVKPFMALSDYEYSLDSGATWQAVTQKPILVGAVAKAEGAVQIRVSAKPDKSIAAGKPLKSSKPFTETQVPAAPTNLVLDDARNRFDWIHSAGFSQLTDYEYTVNGGTTWQVVNSKPQVLADMAIPAGALQLRVREDMNLARPAGHRVNSSVPMTLTPAAPIAPNLVRVDDDADLFEIQLVDGFSNLADYEINLGAGWQPLSSNPYSVGNVDIAADTIRVRIKANSADARPFGAHLIVNQVFTKVLNKPAQPTLPQVDDANNKFGWTVVAGYPQASLYELSIDGGQSFQAVTENPQTIPDQIYGISQVCVRVTASSSNAAGSLLCNDKRYTVTPDAPAAPTNGITDDAIDTFDWTWVPGFENTTDYEVNIESGGWGPVATKPISLEDRAYAQHSIQVRVKANPVDGRPEGGIVSNGLALTKRPDAPAAPTGLVVDDSANTLDWTKVTGFDSEAMYEWSANNGSSWSQVTTKPIVVGDIDKAAGSVHIRVRANASNGMPAGASASNRQPFTQAPKIHPPASALVRVEERVTTNMVDWEYVEFNGVSYDQPHHYEFTNDQGATWQTASAKPQFIGPQAYANSDVAIRVRKNAILGRSNDVGEPLWFDADNATGQFAVVQYVPMLTSGEVADVKAFNRWISSSFGCIAEYDTQGKGEPVFWTSGQYTTSASSVDVSKIDDCGISEWKLPSVNEALQLTQRSSSLIPQFAQGMMVSKGESVWAENSSGQIVSVEDGVTPSKSRTIFPYVKWQLPSSDKLLANASNQVSVLSTTLTDQNNQLVQAQQALTDWVRDNQNGLKSYPTLASEARSQQAALDLIIKQWDVTRESAITTLAKLRFEASAIQSRADADSASLMSKVSEYQRQYVQLESNYMAMNSLVESNTFSAKLADFQQHSVQMANADATLANGSAGLEIHQATLAFFETMSMIESDYKGIKALKKALSNALLGLDPQFADLITSINELLDELHTVSEQNDLDSLAATALEGLRRAHQAGYQVSESAALIDGRFAKIDMLGRFLPKSATYAQGWRCVKDTSAIGNQRLWTLLQDGRPNGVDNVAYQSEDAEKPSLLGANGYLEQANTAVLCGVSDWEIPTVGELKALVSINIAGVKNGGDTLDVSVFPHHRALLPEYDKSSSKGGKEFSYWSSNSYDDNNQYAYQFDSKYSYADRTSHNRSESQLNENYMLARLVKRVPVEWEFVSDSGATVADRASAQCVKNVATGETWQLFQPDASSRFLSYQDIKAELQNFVDSTVCGKSNWTLTSANELVNLAVYRDSIFTDIEVAYSGYPAQLKYVTAASDNSLLELVDASDSEVSTAYHYSHYSYLYRFTAK